MVVTAHQANWLPGRSVYEKAQAADVLLWMDIVQYEDQGYTNRNRLPDGSWMTIPVAKHPTETACRDIRVARGARTRAKLVNKIRHHYPWLAKDDPVFQLIRSAELLCQLNKETWQIVHQVCGWPEPVYLDQSVTGDVSEALATMVKAVGGTEYLSGPSGRTYLDERPFSERGLLVSYWHHEGPNPSMLEAYAAARR